MDGGRADGLADVEALSSLSDPTRRRLYELIAQAGRPVSRDEGALAAGIARPLAAYHLDKLVEHGLLEATYARPAGKTGPGAGRPAKLYQRAPREFVLRAPARDYRLLAELLVRAAASGEVRTTFTRTAREFGRSLGRAARGDPGRREHALQEVLRDRGYEPFVAEPGIVRLRNCPFDDVASRHPDLICGLNLALIRGLLAGIGTEPHRALLAPQEGACCVAIRMRPTSPARERRSVNP